MNYFEEGQKAKKIYKGAKHFGDFIEFTDEILSGHSPDNISEFISGFLTKNKNQMQFTFSIQLATKYDTNREIWGTIIKSFRRLVNGKTKPMWSKNFLEELFDNNTPAFNIDAIDDVVYSILKADDINAIWWLEGVQEEDWFRKSAGKIKDTIIKYATDVGDARSFRRLFRIFNDLYFYRQVVDMFPDSPLLVSLFQGLATRADKIPDFDGGVDLDDLIITYHDRFKNSSNSLSYLAAAIKKYHTEKTGRLFLEMMIANEIRDSTIKKHLLRIKGIGSPEVSAKLYEMTGDDEFLPEDAKDIFLF